MDDSIDPASRRDDFAPRNSTWLGLALVGLVFVVAAALSWRKWPDILVDFGMQLYLPWRISAGDVLYRDVMYVAGGPLSQYFNALLFEIFGVSFRTLIFANLAITAGMLVLIYRRFLAAADQVTATMICLGIVLVFAFQHSTVIGNYNYVTPYCHEVFHGLMLSLLVVMWLSDWIEKKRMVFALMAGFGSGLVFLTKPEIFLALIICVAAGFLIVGCFHRQAGFAVKSLAAFFVAALVPLLAFLVLFLREQNWPSSLRSVVSAWMPLWHTTVTEDLYYRWCLGLDRPFFYLEKMALHIVCIALAVTICAVAFRPGTETYFKRMKPWWLIRWMLVAPFLVLAALADWTECGRGLPMLGLCICGLLLAMNKTNGAIQPAAIFPLLWNVLGLALLAKLGFLARTWHYGFALAMPAFAGAVYLFVWLLPRWLEQRYTVGFRWFRLTACLILMIGFLRLFLRSESRFLIKNTPVGSGGDRIMTYAPSVNPFHENVQLALSWLQKNAPSGATLAVLPEGTMINYLSRRVNPTVYPVWLPPEMEVFGQTNMLAAFQRNSPDYVVIVERSTAEYGEGYFGYYRNYGTELLEWIGQHYERVFPAPLPPGGSLRSNQSYAEVQILKKHQPASGRQ